MHIREKRCANCKNSAGALYRCKYDKFKKIWVFLCKNCLAQVKRDFSETYQYGGTWKAIRTR